MPQGWKIPPHWPFSCSKQETINLLLSKNAKNNISAKRTAPQRRVSAPSQHITNRLAQPRGPAAYTLRPTQRATRVSTRPATRDPRVPCSQAHTNTAQPTRSPALQAQKHVTSPLAQTSRSSSASPDPRLPALQAHMRAIRSSAK